MYDKDRLDPDTGAENPWAWSDAMNIFNGNYHIINHLGHAFTDYAVRTTIYDLDAGLNNALPFFL